MPFAQLFESPLRNGLTKPKAVRGEGMKMVNMGEVFAHRRIQNLDMDRVPMDSRERQNSLLSAGDLLFARQSLVLSGAGKCCLFQGDKEEVTFESHIIRCRLNQKKADPAFYFYLFQSQQGRSLIESIVEQVAAAGIRGSDLGRLEVPVPPLHEQKAIASILGALDDKIELNRRMNATLEAMARALFQSWFVDFDPVRAKLDGRPPTGLDPETAALFPATFQDSPLSHIPQGWEIGRLDDVLTLQRGFDLPTPDRTHGKYPVMAASGPNGCHDKFMVHGPGVTTGRSGVLGKVFFIHGEFWPLNTSLWVKEFKRVSPAYAFHLLRELDFEMFNSGSAVPTLNRNHVHNLQVIMPPKDIIGAFDAQIMPLMLRQKANEDQSRTLAIIRDTFLPKLLSGQLRDESKHA
jgi:type I restriction enzyme S subunit